MMLFVLQRAPNFGDQLNHLVFPKVLGPIFDRDPRFLVLGIGTVIDAQARRGLHEIIVGAGAGYRAGRHSLENRTIYAVRGPLTSRLLGAPDETAAIDPGILVGRLYPRDGTAGSGQPLFMPHWQTDRAAGEAWRAACEAAGFDYVSPLADKEEVLATIQRGPLLVTEALHGAVTAEAYGIPWIPVVLGPKLLDFKWQDWCASIGIEYRPRAKLPLLHGAAPIPAGDRFKRLVASAGVGKRRWQRIALRASRSEDIDRAATALAAISGSAEHYVQRGNPHLTSRGVERLERALEEFRRDFANGRFEQPPASGFSARPRPRQ